MQDEQEYGPDRTGILGKRSPAQQRPGGVPAQDGRTWTGRQQAAREEVVTDDRIWRGVSHRR